MESYPSPPITTLPTGSLTRRNGAIKLDEKFLQRGKCKETICNKKENHEFHVCFSSVSLSVVSERNVTVVSCVREIE